MSRQQTTGHSDWIRIPYFRRCWVGEDRVELTPPLIFGRSYLFDGTRQVVTIRRCLLGRTLSEEEISFSDVSVFLGHRYIEEKTHYSESGPSTTPGGLLYFIAMTMGRDKPWVKVFEENSLGDRSRADRILAAIQRLGL